MGYKSDRYFLSEKGDRNNDLTFM